MKHPDKWRETADPFALPFRNFVLQEIIGYPHAGNDVFQAKGLYRQKQVDVYIKIARQVGADIKNEVATISSLNCVLVPEIIDFSDNYMVTLAKKGDRLSVIVGDNSRHISHNYLYEYGRALALLHKSPGVFPHVKDRKFFHIPDKSYFETDHLHFVYDYLTSHRPNTVNECFCHGDFHYANILWEGEHISAILDFELSGIGNKEFDIAWALILRPGQRFLNSEEEISLSLIHI